MLTHWFAHSPDALDTMKKVFKGLFSSKKKDKTHKHEQEATPTTTAESSAAAHAKPTETTPSAPAPAIAPAPAKTETTPPVAADAPAPAAPAPAHGEVEPEAKKEEVAPLTELKKATESRSISIYTGSATSSAISPVDCSDGSRWRMKADMDDDWTGRG